jgi:aspartyl-tRNA(Asn)/glutamyl-tRNA(Gln) amidotransferase subunit C
MVGDIMISEQEFRELALLARLDPEDESLKDLREDFNRILEFVDKIADLDTSSVSDIRSVNETVNVFRKDEPGETIPPSVIGDFASEWEAGHFVVPGAIESEG